MDSIESYARTSKGLLYENKIKNTKLLTSMMLQEKA